MNICFSTYPWAFDIKGGGEHQLMHYKTNLLKRDVNVSLYDMWSAGFSECDLIHFFSVMSGSMPFLDYVKTKKGLPLIVSPNFWPDPDSWEKSGVSSEVETILWLANKIIVNSYIELEYMVRVLKIDSSYIDIVYNAVDKTYFEMASPDIFREKFNIAGPYILNVANVEPRKNQFAFLQALKKFPDYKLIVIGRIRDQWYMNECTNVGKDQFIFLGPLPSGSVLLKSAFAGCEFFAMPSLVETPSIASLEAAASGAKLLTIPIGSTKEYFLDMATYVNPYDLSSIEDGIRGILTEKSCSELREHVLQNFTWESVMESLIKVYERVLCP